MPARSLKAGLFGKTLEEALQTLIEKHPEVLPGKQIAPESDDPPRFILLCREMSIGGWSLDHLLVDQRAVLTLVEAKLIQSPEARRSVIGQIMEYAANTLETWGNGQARKKAEEFWLKKGKGIDYINTDLICKKLCRDDVEVFWDEVEENLKQRRIRLIIAADQLRSEVQRTIEYLNTEMETIEIYGLEIHCYGDESSPLVIVPRLMGKSPFPPPTDLILWTVERLRNAYNNLLNHDMGERLLIVLEWEDIKFTEGITGGTLYETTL